MLNYDYTSTKAYCKKIGLHWLGDDFSFLVSADKAAKDVGMTQQQVETVMVFHLSTTKYLWTPSTYKFIGRLVIAFCFLFNVMPRGPK